MMALEFGDNADGDTFDAVFGHFAVGYVVAVNGVDMVVHSTIDDGVTGLYGYAYNGEEDAGDRDRPVGFDWEDIESIYIY